MTDKGGYYNQCRMSRVDDNGKRFTVAYIPSWCAKVGIKIQLVTLDNDFWRVDEVGEKVTADFVKENERNYKEFQGSTKGGGID